MLPQNGQISQKKFKTGRNGGIRCSFLGLSSIYRYGGKKRGLGILFSETGNGKCGEDVSPGADMGQSYAG